MAGPNLVDDLIGEHSGGVGGKSRCHEGGGGKLYHGALYRQF